MPHANLSPDAIDLLRRRMSQEAVPVTEDNRPLYRELMAAGLVEPISTFLHGREGNYRPTEAAIAFLATALPTRTPIAAPAVAPARHG